MKTTGFGRFLQWFEQSAETPLRGTLALLLMLLIALVAVPAMSVLALAAVMQVAHWIQTFMLYRV